MLKYFLYRIFKLFPKLARLADQTCAQIFNEQFDFSPDSGLRMLRSEAFGKAKYVREQADLWGQVAIVDDENNQLIMVVCGRNQNEKA